MSLRVRKPVAMIILVIWLIAYIVGIASLSGLLADAPRPVQLVFYVIAGVAWVLPLRPLFRWMNAPSGAE